MNRLVALLGAALLAAAAMPAAAEGMAPRNRAWLLEQVDGRYDPDAMYSGVVGTETVTLRGAEIVDRAVARMGDVDMPAMAAAAVVAPGNAIGDIWLIGFGPGTCGPNHVLFPWPFFFPVDGQMWVYAGAIGLGAAEGFTGFSIGWTTKTTGTFGPQPLTYGVNSDYFCFDGFLFFPFIDGFWAQEMDP